MAVTAKFQADFNSFYAAVQKAEVQLKGLDSGAGRAEQALNRMVNSFSGRRIIQDATLAAEAVQRIGGVSKLTEQEQRKLSGTLSEALSKFKAMGVEAPPAMMKLAEATGAITPKLTLMDKAANLAKSSFGQMFGAFTGANLAANLIGKLSGEVTKFIEEGSRLGAVEQSFQRLTATMGTDGNKMLTRLQEGTRGLVSSFDLMLSANKAMLLGLPVTTESMGEMAKAATTLGKAMGKDATSSLDDLITALGRSSPMILDNLGLTVKVEEANKKYAEALGKSATALTESEKKTAFYVAAMEAARKKTAELGEQSKTLGELGATAWTKLGNAARDAVASLNVGLGAALSSGQKFGMFLEDLITKGPGAALALSRIREEAMKLANVKPPDTLLPAEGTAQLENYFNSLMKLRTEMESLTPQQKNMILLATELGQSHAEIAKGVGASEAAVKRYADSMKGAAEETAKLREKEKELFSDMREFGLKVIQEVSDAFMKAQLKMGEAIGTAMANILKMHDEASKRMSTLFDLGPVVSTVDQQLAELQKTFESRKEALRLESLLLPEGPSAMRDKVQETLNMLTIEYDRTFVDIVEKGNQFGANLSGEISGSGPELGQAAQTAAQPLIQNFIGAFDKVTAGAKRMVIDIAAELERVDDMYKKAGIFIPTGLGNVLQAQRRTAVVRSIPWPTDAAPSGGAMYTPRGGGAGMAAGSQYTINVTANGQREGRAAGDAVIAALKAGGVRI